MRKLFKNFNPLIPMSIIPGIKAEHDEQSFEYKAAEAIIKNFNKEYDPTVIKVLRAWKTLDGKVLKINYLTQVYFKGSVTMQITNEIKHYAVEDFDFNLDVVNNGFKELAKSDPAEFSSTIKNTTPPKGFFGESVYYETSPGHNGAYFPKNFIIDKEDTEQSDKKRNIARIIINLSDHELLPPESIYEINKILHEYKEACGWLL